jgi:hypothetical protein
VIPGHTAGLFVPSRSGKSGHMISSAFGMVLSCLRNTVREPTRIVPRAAGNTSNRIAIWGGECCF